MNKRTERLAALALFLLCAAIVWSQLDAHVRAQTSIPGPGSATISVTSSNGALETTQTLVHGRLGTFNTNLGATNDTAASTDTGTFSLIALIKRIATHLTRVWQGPQASCAHYRGTTTSVSAGSSGTSIDAGATGTVYWLAVSNLSRTYDIQISADTGTFRVPPSGSVTLSNPGAATADSITVATNCTGCGGAATNVTVLACDDD